MITSILKTGVLDNIRHNCDISDARDHGMYSMCTMVLKLRNLYKWEKGIQPWEEPETVDLLDWIETKENYWASIAQESYRPLQLSDGQRIDPGDPVEFYDPANKTTLLYGAGYGRSMKAVFFLAEKLEQRNIEGCQVDILGTEKAKEMSSPFAMVQDGTIIIRKDSLRYFLWDHVQELRSSCRGGLHHALQSHEILSDGKLDNTLFKARLDAIVEKEMNLFIYHEVGEIHQKTLDTTTFRNLVGRFPGSVIEFICRALKDTLADTHPKGPLAYILRKKSESTLSFYIGFVDGLRKKLFPEIMTAWQHFLQTRDWSVIEEARVACRNRNLQLAEKVRRISQMIDSYPDKHVQSRFNNDIILPLGLEIHNNE